MSKRNDKEIQKRYQEQEGRFLQLLSEKFGLSDLKFRRANTVSAYASHVYLETELPKRGNKKIFDFLQSEGWVQQKPIKDWDREGKMFYSVRLSYLIEKDSSGGYAGVKPKKHEFSKVQPYCFSELCYNSYDVQNMLIVQHDYPTFCYEGDYSNNQYSDRFSYEEWEEAKKILPEKLRVDEWRRLSKDELLKFASKLYKREISGIRIVRYTNRSNGYPLYRIDVFAKGEFTPNDHVFEPNYLPVKRNIDNYDEIEYVYG